MGAGRLRIDGPPVAGCATRRGLYPVLTVRPYFPVTGWREPTAAAMRIARTLVSAAFAAGAALIAALSGDPAFAGGRIAL